MRLKYLIPGLLMPVVCAAVYLAVSRTGQFFRLYVDLFGYDEVGPGVSFLCFPLLALLTGAVPAVLLSGKERNVRAGWTAVFFALFYAAEVLRVLPSGPVDPCLFSSCGSRAFSSPFCPTCSPHFRPPRSAVWP